MARFRKKKKDTEPRGLYVEVRNNNIEAALRKFKKMIKSSNLMLELRQRSYYEKPSDERRRRRSAAISRARHQEKKKKLQKN